MYWVFLLAILSWHGGLSLPCHFCHDGQISYGQTNYSFAELGAASCSLPSTVECSVCVESTGDVAFSGGLVHFGLYRGCGPNCSTLIGLAVNMTSQLPNMTVIELTCRSHFECDKPFCNSHSKSPPSVYVFQTFLPLLGLVLVL